MAAKLTPEQEHNAVAHDAGLESGEHPIGELVHISTVTHAFRGVLREVTPSYYILDNARPVALVDSTGAFAGYFAKPLAAREGDVWTPPKSGARPTMRILRGAGSWLVSFGRP